MNVLILIYLNLKYSNNIKFSFLINKKNYIKKFSYNLLLLIFMDYFFNSM